MLAAAPRTPEALAGTAAPCTPDKHSPRRAAPSIDHDTLALTMAMKRLELDDVHQHHEEARRQLVAQQDRLGELQRCVDERETYLQTVREQQEDQRAILRDILRLVEEGQEELQAVQLERQAGRINLDTDTHEVSLSAKELNTRTTEVTSGNDIPRDTVSGTSHDGRAGAALLDTTDANPLDVLFDVTKDLTLAPPPALPIVSCEELDQIFPLLFLDGDWRSLADEWVAAGIMKWDHGIRFTSERLLDVGQETEQVAA